ncbi:MAG: hypothetical protein Q8Q88_12075 [Phenylobacterium sp.]|uniref:DUF883 family protein n=1 Tax=Phenylobacterium sp. TaxID=1871053 RepID=UPI002733CDA0|nr:hypothetical protein [Phenylobacterium sp.]MDP3747772.1 hypothetical protein [Phenylobacterium sp.]
MVDQTNNQPTPKPRRAAALKQAAAPLVGAASDLAHEAKVALTEKASVLQAKAQEGYGVARQEARKRLGEAETFVQERPYASLAIAAFAGFLIGHIISNAKTNVVYLRDER